MVANQIPSNIANFSRQERQKYLYRSISGLVSGISYLHKEIDGRVITHHDLKPLNILIVDDKLQIADFGHSRLRPVIEGSATEGRLGTYEYQPPEYYNQDGSRAQGKYGRAFDVWAVGCIIIELATLIVHDWQSEMVNIFREERKSNSSRERESPTDIDQNLDFSFHNNLNVVTHWLSCLKQDGESRQLDEVLNIANGMLASKPENRLKMWEVSMDLHETMKKYDKEFIPNLEGLCEEPPRGREETIYTFDCDVPGWVTYTGEGIENRSETPLHRAAKNNNRLRTIRLWELGWPLSLRDANGETSLEIMKRSYDTELQKLEDNVISMIEAAGAGNIEEVKRLFSRGLSRLMVNAHGRSAMFEAVRCSQIYVVDYLLESEVKEQLMLPDRRSCYLPLHMAAATGVVNVLERLLKHYSDVNIFDQRGHTALFCAVSASHTDAVRLLIKNKAQLMPLINNHKRSISSPLHQALDLCEDSEVVEIVKLLLEAEDYRKCLDELDLDKTPLMIAAERGSVDCFELLFKAGASIHGYSSNKTTLLHKIIEHDQLDILRQYIHHFSSEDFRLHNIHGETPLQAAQGAKHKEIPRLLKSRMAQLSIFDKKESRVSAFLRNTKDIFAEVFCIPSNEGRNQLSEAREREYHR
jgi:ankyrin repeat protein